MSAEREYQAAAAAGARALDEGDLAAAERALRVAVDLRPAERASWYNLALVHKFRRDWSKALEAGLRSVPAPEGDPAWWNLGIAATALREWEIARRAWRSFGVELPAGEGEIEAELGVCLLRLSPQKSPETAWARRLDPARAVLLSVPTPESGRRWGDILLHDGEQRGERRVGRRAYPVFDELEVWRRSPTPTFSVQITAASEVDVEALVAAAEKAGGAAEDWSTMRLVCPECDLGTPGHSHPGEPWQPTRTVGLAFPAGLAEALLNRWWDERPGSRGWRDLSEVG